MAFVEQGVKHVYEWCANEKVYALAFVWLTPVPLMEHTFKIIPFILQPKNSFYAKAKAVGFSVL